MTFMIRMVFVLLLLSIAACTVTDGRREANLSKAAEFNAQLATNYMQQGSLEQAKFKYDKALEQDPDNPRANSGYALLMATLGAHEEAERYFQRAMSLDSKNPQVLNNYGTYLCGRDKPDEAEKYFLLAVSDRLYATPEYAYTNAGNCAMRVKDTKKALSYYQNALMSNPEFPPALLASAELGYKFGRYRAALNYLDKYRSLSQETPQSLFLASRLYRALGDYNRSAQYGLKLRRLYPSSQLIKQLEQ